MRPTGIQIIPDLADVAIEELKSIGLNVDVQTLEWAALLQRRLKTDPPSAGG
ncbi:MAG: hypothetical protein EBS21_11620, partial [Sphingomonadaceae bacterium]|nr:hypothetical protein [Sphingomonadaceae bacterium]